MSRGLIGIIGGAVLLLGLVVAGLTMYHPPRPSYINATPAPVGQPAASVPPTVPPATTSAPAPAGALEVGDRELLVATSLLPEQIRLEPGTPVIVSFLAQTPDLQSACRLGDAVLDAGQCAMRGLSVGALNREKARIPLTVGQAQMLLTARDAHVALTVAPDNALMMAATRQPQPAGSAAPAAPTTAPTAAPAAQAAPAPAADQSTAAVASTTTLARLGRLPLVPIAVGALALITLGGLAVLARRRGRAPAIGLLGDMPGATPLVARAPNAGRAGRGRGLRLRGRGAKQPASVTAPVRAELSLDLGGAEVQPLLDDDAAARAERAADPFAQPVAPSSAAMLDSAAGTEDRAGDTAPRLGAPLPPARPPEALPPAAALDRQAALRWRKTNS